MHFLRQRFAILVMSIGLLLGCRWSGVSAATHWLQDVAMSGVTREDSNAAQSSGTEDEEEDGEDRGEGDDEISQLPLPSVTLELGEARLLARSAPEHVARLHDLADVEALKRPPRVG